MCIGALKLAGGDEGVVEAGEAMGLELEVAGEVLCRDKGVIDVAFKVRAVDRAAVTKVVDGDVGTEGDERDVDGTRSRVAGDVAGQLGHALVDGIHHLVDRGRAIGDEDDAAVRAECRPVGGNHLRLGAITPGIRF